MLLCVQPGSGDALQFMKAGIMEVPDLVLVTKGDLGAPAERAAGDLRGALSLAVGAPTNLPEWPWSRPTTAPASRQRSTSSPAAAPHATPCRFAAARSAMPGPPPG